MTKNNSEKIISADDVCYQSFGKDVNLLFFYSTINALDQDIRDVLYDVAVRLKQLKTVEEPSLRLYMLCTCIDRLGNPHWLTFNDWLITKKRKYSIQERDKKFQHIDNNYLQISSSAEFQRQIQELFSLYSKQHGTGRKFKQLIFDLPDPIKKLLSESYIIVSGKENFWEPTVIEGWLLLKQDECLERIASYIYEYRRNDYTHAIKEHKTSRTAWPDVHKSVQDALDLSPESMQGWQILTIYENNDPQRDIELTVLVNKDESYMLQLAVVGYCRKILDLAVDDEFVVRHTEQGRTWEILKEAEKELNRNWQSYKYYSIDWMSHEDSTDLYHGLPEFKLSWLASVLDLALEEYGLMAKELQRNIAGVISGLKAVNKPIQVFNDEHPPLYIREKREYLRDVPEDLQLREQNKSKLFDEIQSMHEYHIVRWYLAQVRVDLSVISKTNPVMMEQDIQGYGSSAPNYRSWL